MKTLLLLCCGLLAVTGVSSAQTARGLDRNWGFGWDDGLTLRRNLGVWQIGVSAGPNDYLADRDTHTFDNDRPDSTQGALTGQEKVRRESGFVRLHLARELATYHTLSFHGLVSGIYTWSDYKTDYLRYSSYNDTYSMTSSKEFTEYYDLMAGGRLSWFPLPFVSLETEFGLWYRWTEVETDRSESVMGETDWSRDVGNTREGGFNDFGPYSLTGDVQIIVWF